MACGYRLVRGPQTPPRHFEVFDPKPVVKWVALAPLLGGNLGFSGRVTLERSHSGRVGCPKGGRYHRRRHDGAVSSARTTVSGIKRRLNSGGSEGLISPFSAEHFRHGRIVLESSVTEQRRW